MDYSIHGAKSTDEDNDEKQLLPANLSRELGRLEINEQDEVLKQIVKSSAVVKYGLFNHPLQYLQLNRNTNLNKPPSNWLRCSSPMEQYIRQASKLKHHSPYASLVMANDNLDEVGEVDVISDSENIKTLMRLPYDKSQPVSMMVHRIGKTLFLDDFDVHKNLLRQQQEDWKWLRKFYYETVLQTMSEETQPRQVKGRNLLQSRNMFSKFLYYSVDGSSSHGRSDDKPSLDSTSPMEPDRHNISPQSAGSESEFSRTVHWTFEDIRMLIGTDLPIFGGGTHPCVSLRLRDMRQSINVLTGLDYWLDNLMCNVPELAMCYHLNGIVQKYELVSTNDIPSLDGCQFSPSVIRDVAQNILSFLKTNVTKEGHTYWLFKGPNDDVIKLYDLTTLCSDEWDDNSDNPFTVPVGILLFRVASNIMKMYGREKSGTIRTLLKNCLTLLDHRTHAQIVASACYMLADLYVKDDLHDQELPKDGDTVSSVDDDTESVGESRSDIGSESYSEDCSDSHPSEDYSEERSGDRSEISLPVTSLCLSEQKPSGYLDVVGYAPLTSDLEERCKEALKAIAEGLTCLERSVETDGSHSTNASSPDRPIPLGYSKLNLVKSTDDSPQSADDGPQSATDSPEPVRPSDLTLSGPGDRRPADLPVSPVRSRPVPTSWQEQCRIRLINKAAYVYYWLADIRAKACKYGRSLRCLRNATICLETVRSRGACKASEYEVSLRSLLTMCGDMHMMLARDRCIQIQADMYEMTSDYDKIILINARPGTGESGADVGLMTVDPVTHLTRANAAYSQVLELLDDSKESDSSDTIRRYGSSLNELGVMHMNKLAQIFAEHYADDLDLIKGHEELWSTCLRCFDDAVESFERIDDRTNIGLVCSNKARLMRVLAQGSIQYTNHERGEFTPREKTYFIEAVDEYRAALKALCTRERCPDVWDSVRWELSSSYFSLATLLQDYAPLSYQSQHEIEKEVTAAMDKALKYCDVDIDSSRLPTCQYRAATIHHRLASLYHNSFRNQVQ